VLPKGVRELVTLGSGGYHGTFKNYAMSEFARHLSGWVGNRERVPYVGDKTGLTGRYDFKFAFNPDQSSVMLGIGTQAALAGRNPPEAPNGLPDLFQALERQLGLRLIKGKDVPRDTILVDPAERIPSGS
jgi:uncharacterized protein (TIGR03435 family)